MKKISFVIAFLVALSPACFAEGLQSLIELGRGQAEIQKAYDEETKTYEHVKEAVDSGTIAKGQSKDSIKERYGEPVVALQDSATNREHWIYKPAASNFFKGPKIHLFFDAKSALDEIKVIQ